MTFPRKNEELVPNFQVVGPKTVAVPSISSPPLQLDVALEIPLPLLSNAKYSCMPFVGDDVPSKNDVRLL
jgi:hypothetical protein